MFLLKEIVASISELWWGCCEGLMGSQASWDTCSECGQNVMVQILLNIEGRFCFGRAEFIFKNFYSICIMSRKPLSNLCGKEKTN